MSLAQKLLGGLLFLGAGALVLSHPKGFAAFANGAQQLTSGSITNIVKSSGGN